MTGVFDSLAQDVRYALRTLAARPGWTAAAVTCLAIATGANTAAFTFVNGLLLRPLPFDRPDELYMIAQLEQPSGVTHPFTRAEYQRIADGNIGRFLAWTYQDVSLAATNAGAQMAEAQFVSGNYFDVLGVTPYAGRFFAVDEDRRAERVAVLGHETWMRRFGGNLHVLGRAVRVNGVPVSIIGITPPGFVGSMQLIGVDLYLPWSLHPTITASDGATTMFGVMGRIPGAIGPERAGAQIEAILADTRRASGIGAASHVLISRAAGFGVPPVAQGMVIGFSGFVFGLMALLMTVAAANVAALVLARSVTRMREIGVRLALGAGRVRIARQLFTESLVLSVIGCAAGGFAASWLTTAMVAEVNTPFSFVSYAVDVSPDVRVFVYASLLTATSAVLCALAPVRHALRADLVHVLKAACVPRQGRTSRTFDVLVAGQFAISTTLLAGAGLVARVYLNASSVEPGFDADHVLAASLDVRQAGMRDAAGQRFYRELSRRLAALPGVDSVSLSRLLPYGGALPTARVTPVRGSERASAESFAAGIVPVGDQFFRTVGLPLLEGHSFEEGDRSRPLTAVVNRTMARRLALRGSPVGSQFDLDGPNGGRLEVIGVVPDLTYGSATSSTRPAFYRPFAQDYSPAMSVLVRSTGPPAALAEQVRDAVAALQPDLAIRELRTAREQLDQDVRSRRGPTIILLVICGLGLLLSAIGLYGVVSYGVRQRAQELGIRLALGATPRDVTRLVVSQGLRIAACGALVGLGASVLLARVLRSALYGVRPTDPVTLAIVCGVLLAAALLALYRPARWATRIEPADTLRAD